MVVADNSARTAPARPGPVHLRYQDRQIIE